MQFKQLYDGLVSSSIRDLSLTASDAKKGMFDHLILKRDLDKKKIRAWLNGVNDFLTYWCGYAEDLVEVMKTTKGEAGIYALPYADVKDYIYTSYDLPSVLKFADAVIDGINKKELSKPDEIKELFVEYVNKAFPNRADDVGGLLSEVLQSEGRPTARSTDSKEAKLFDTAKKYKWYSATDHSTIYKAIETTCTYMTEKYGLEKNLSTSDLKLYVSVINMTVEYMMYTLVAYATRIYMISLYTWSHYSAIHYGRGKDSCVDGRYTESTKWEENIGTMQESDDLLLRDPAQLNKLADRIHEFLKAIGANRDEPGDTSYKSYRYLPDDKVKDNAFFTALFGNELLEFLKKRPYEYPSQNLISETKHRLRDVCLNELHGISTETTAKQAFLHAIRGVQPDAETLVGYRKLAGDLAVIGLNALSMAKGNLHDYESWSVNMRQDMWEGQRTINDISECKRLISELYREIAQAVMSRFRDIEMRYNELSGTTLDDINKQLEIKVPGVKSDRSLDDNMASAVPSSTRVPIDVIQVYASEVFDEAAMYLDWLRTKPELTDYWYVNEAAGNPVDNLIAFFQSIWRRIMNFFNGQSFKKARAWVEKNQEPLKQMSFQGIELKGLPPYKDTIVVGDHYNELIKGLSQFDPNYIKSQDQVDHYVASLYPNKVVASWFPVNGQNIEAGKQRWRNYFLFRDLENATDQKVDTITLTTDADIRKRMSNAIRDIMQSDAWLKELDSLNNRIAGGMNHLKQSTIRIKMESVYLEADGDPAPEAPKAADGAGSTGGTGGSGTGGSGKTESIKAEVKDTKASGSTPATQQSAQQQQQNGVNPQLMKSVFQGTQAVLNNIWFSATNMIVEYVMTQYQTITKLYDIATEQQNKIAQQNNGQQQTQQNGGTAGNAPQA